MLGQDVYLHLNHPIKWVRISGVVVAVDEWERRRVYTIDDGSGATIQCVVHMAPGAPPGAVRATTAKPDKAADEPRPLAVIDAPIDVGHVLDIKGSVTTFRDARNVRAEKIAHLRSTEQEVLFWEKVARLRREVLSKPWVLDRREVKRCRREEERGYSSRRSRHHHHHRGSGEKHEGKQADRTDSKTMDWKGEGGNNRHETKPLAVRPVRRTGLEKRQTKSVTRLIPVTGNYDALGL